MVRKNLVLAIVLLIGLVFSTCGGKPTPDVQAIETQTAAKIYATQTASVPIETATPQPTVTSEFSNSIPPTIASTPSQPTLLNFVGRIRSQFCRVYHCRGVRSYKLQSGGTNHTYDTSIDPGVSIDISTIDDKPVYFGLSLYDRENPTQDDLQYIFLFLESVVSGRAD